MIQFGNDKIKDIYVGSDKIKEVYYGSELVYGSSFNGILYDNGFEGVEWEQGFTYGASNLWLLDKSQNVLHAQVMGSASGQEAAWTTKNPIDASKFNNLRLEYAYSAAPTNVIRVGVFISPTKNNSAYGNQTQLSQLFPSYVYHQSGTSTGMQYNLPFDMSPGEYYVSIHALKLSTGNYSGFIKLKKAVFELIPYIMFLADSVDVGFEQGYIYGSGTTQITPSNLHASSGSDGLSTIVSTSKVNVTLFKTLRVNFRNNGNEGVVIGLVDNKLDDIPYPYGYSSATGVDAVLDFDITNISGEKYIAMQALGDNVLLNVTRVELIP